MPGLVDAELGFGRFAAQPVRPVEDEGGVPCAAVRRPDRPGALVRRRNQGGGQPREPHDDVHSPGCGELQQAPPAIRRHAEIGEHEQAGQGDERLEQLHVEGHAEHRGGAEQPPAAAALAGAHQQQQREHDQDHHHPVHRVAARGDHRDRQHGQRERRGEPRGGAPDAPDDGEQQRHRCDPGESLRQLQGRRAE